VWVGKANIRNASIHGSFANRGIDYANSTFKRPGSSASITSSLVFEVVVFATPADPIALLHALSKCLALVTVHTASIIVVAATGAEPITLLEITISGFFLDGGLGCHHWHPRCRRRSEGIWILPWLSARSPYTTIGNTVTHSRAAASVARLSTGEIVVPTLGAHPIALSYR
jgi:hypothetical protein